MRVIGGKAKGRSLKAVPGDGTRPILDRVKTSLFDLLRPRISGLEVLDLFAGSGGVGIEALSQGAAHCTFIELAPKAVEVVRENLKHTGLSEQAEVRCTDAFRYLKSCNKAFDLIYVAPPQFQTLWNQAMQSIAERPDLLKSGGEIVVQIDPKEYEALKLTNFAEYDQRRYGNTLLVFFRKV